MGLEARSAALAAASRLRICSQAPSACTEGPAVQHAKTGSELRRAIDLQLRSVARCSLHRLAVCPARYRLLRYTSGRNESTLGAEGGFRTHNAALRGFHTGDLGRGTTPERRRPSFSYKVGHDAHRHMCASMSLGHV